MTRSWKLLQLLLLKQDFKYILMPQQLVDRETNQEAFPKLSEDNLQELSQFGESRQVNDGETLVKAGEKEFDFYIIESGHVRVVDTSSGEERTITTLGERDRKSVV